MVTDAYKQIHPRCLFGRAVGIRTNNIGKAREDDGLEGPQISSSGQDVSLWGGIGQSRAVRQSWKL